LDYYYDKYFANMSDLEEIEHLSNELYYIFFDKQMEQT